MRKTSALVLIFAFSIFAVGCNGHICAEDALSAILSEVSSLPAGNAKSTTANEYDDDYLDMALLRIMFSEASSFGEEKKIEEAAIFLSGTEELCEIIVAKATSYSDAEDIAELFAKRIGYLKSSPALSSESKSVLQNAKVVISGKFVLYTVSNYSEKICKVFKNSLK